MQVIEHLIDSLQKTGLKYNPGEQEAPVCIIWPDRDRQWEKVITNISSEIPELLILGEYDAEKYTGPAIWLRCVIPEKMKN